LNHAYSLLQIKSVDEESRVIQGLASTPELDRGGDIMEPSGAKFSLPMPLLWQHKADQPIGHVTEATVTPQGIWIKATIAKDVLPRIDEAWALIKSRLVGGLSIGWKPLAAPKVERGAARYSSWEWFETSAVTVPMNPGSTIAQIKSIDAPDLAASGRGQRPKQVGTPGVAGLVVRLAKKDAPTTMKTYTEQISEWTSKKTAAELRMDEIMKKSADEGVTLDDQQKQEYDTLETEVKSINEHLARLVAAEQRAKATAVPVTAATPADGAAARAATPVIAVKDNLEPGLEFCRVVLCKAAAFSEFMKGNPVSALDIAKQRYPDNNRVHQYLLQQKTAVAGGTTTDANFAAALLAPSQVLANEFLAYLRPKTIIGKFGQNGIPSLKRVPFNVTIQSQTSGASASWVGQGKAKPVTKFNTTTTSLLFTKIAAISVITDELARFSSPGAEGVVRDELGRAVIERMDRDFVDPDKAVSAGVNPASITNGVTGLTTAGTSAANVLTDIQGLIAPFITNNYDVGDLVIIIPNSLALVLSLMLNSLGQRAFPDIEIGGGRLAGIPVITSQYVAMGSSYGNMVIAVSASNIALADDGVVTVDASREASIEMSDAPSGDATNGTGASMVSMFQTNSIALRAERVINWKKLRSTAVTYFDDVNWGSIGSPF
jgi:HK97 family phage major capsid protein/HK97 family phage prohead protease